MVDGYRLINYTSSLTFRTRIFTLYHCHSMETIKDECYMIFQLIDSNPGSFSTMILASVVFSWLVYGIFWFLGRVTEKYRGKNVFRPTQYVTSLNECAWWIHILFNKWNCPDYRVDHICRILVQPDTPEVCAQLVVVLLSSIYNFHTSYRRTSLECDLQYIDCNTHVVRY